MQRVACFLLRSFSLLAEVWSALGLRKKVPWPWGYLAYIAKTTAKNQATHCTLGMLGLWGVTRSDGVAGRQRGELQCVYIYLCA